MTKISASTPVIEDREPLLTRGLLTFLAVACGMTVANLYYNQPLLTELQQSFSVSIAQIGSIPMLTQLGYACGMLLITPLGDQHDRKRLILVATFSTCMALLLAGLSTHFLIFRTASFLIGLSAVGAQIIIPHVAELSSDKGRGAAVGRIMTGLLLGILLARTLSGYVGSLWGWRTVYVLSACAMFVLGLVMMRRLPSSRPSFQGHYLALLGSMAGLVRTEPVLRQCSLIGACVFASFSAVWATLVFLLNGDPFYLGPMAAGSFGILGTAGAMSALVVGRMADQKGPILTSRVAIAVTLVSFVILLLSAKSLAGLIVGFFLMDAGVQSAHVANQARFFRVRPEARSRTNTVYMFCYFVGGAAGSWMAALVWQRAQWLGVCGLCLAFIAVALLVAMVARPGKRNHVRFT